jgi:hypothetical protein
MILTSSGLKLVSIAAFMLSPVIAKFDTVSNLQ